MARSDCFVSVIAPLWNDEDIVGAFIDDVIGVLRREYTNYELVLVDDGSGDGTVGEVVKALARHECIRLIRLSRHFGQETALSAGLDSVIGDFTVVMQPDRDPPALIPKIVEQCRTGLGVVFGVRKDRRGDPLLLKAGARLLYWYFNRVLKISLPRDSTDFRVYSRQALNAIISIRDRLRYLRTFAAYVGYGSDSFTYEFAHRRKKPRGKTLGQAVRMAMSMVVANSTHPLRFVSVLGLALSAVNLLYMVYVLIIRFTTDNTMPGWATLSLQMSVMLMFVFLILSMLCEYVGRLLGEVRDRPLYYVLEERSSSVMIANEQRKNVVTDSVEGGK